MFYVSPRRWRRWMSRAAEFALFCLSLVLPIVAFLKAPLSAPFVAALSVAVLAQLASGGFSRTDASAVHTGGLAAALVKALGRRDDRSGGP